MGRVKTAIAFKDYFDGIVNIPITKEEQTKHNLMVRGIRQLTIKRLKHIQRVWDEAGY